MTRALALDTSTWWCGVALLETVAQGPTVVAALGVRVQDSHAARLLRLVDLLLGEVGWSRTELDLFVATRGPGSFTGVRIGLGTVRGLAVASGRPCVGVGTLEAMAEAFGPAEAERVPLLDAGRGEVYGARFDAAGSPPQALEPPWVGPPERALAGEGPRVLFGPAVAVHEARLRRAGWRGPRRHAPTCVAAGAGRLALALGLAPGAGMEPLYVRPPDAERQAPQH